MMHAEHDDLKYCFRLNDIGSKRISLRFADRCDSRGCFNIVVTRRLTRCIRAYQHPELYADYIYLPLNTRNDFIPASTNLQGRQPKDRQVKVDFCEFTFSLARFPLDSGGFEVVATNLGMSEFSSDDLRDLYQMRWGVETAFRQLKYDDCASFSHTKKKAAAIGEIILSMLFHNICVSVILAACSLVASRIGMRHAICTISYSDAADTLRLFMSGRSPTFSAKKIVRELSLTMQPVRLGRHFKRFLTKRTFIAFIYRAA